MYFVDYDDYTGMVKESNSNTEITEEFFVLNGKINGPYKSYDVNNDIIEDTNYVDGYKIGLSTFFNIGTPSTFEYIYENEEVIKSYYFDKNNNRIEFKRPERYNTCLNCGNSITNLRCITCNAMYCDNCWSDCNDENLHLEQFGDKFVVDSCDRCNYGCHCEFWEFCDRCKNDGCGRCGKKKPFCLCYTDFDKSY